MCLKELRKKLKWLDPFTYVDLYLMPRINPNDSELISWGVYLVSAFFFAWVIYTGLGLILGTVSPMMIVVSSSMEPLYHRGDILILQGADEKTILGKEVELPLEQLSDSEFESFADPVYSQGTQNTIESIEFDSGETIPITQEGSIVVYWGSYLNEPIVHRVVAKLHAQDGWFLLTKGDSVNNSTIDQDCGYIINGRPEKPCINLYPVKISELQGKTLFSIPVLGCVKLWLLDDLGSLLRTGKMPAEFSQGNFC